MVLNGEARRARQVVKILSSDGKVVYAKPHYPMVWLLSFQFLGRICFSVCLIYLAISNVPLFLCQLRGSDTSTAESGSEAEDIASPKATRTYSHLRLTPVREEVA